MDPTKIKPIGTRILVELEDLPETFAGGQLLLAHVPDSQGIYTKIPQRGKVLAIGPGVKDIDVGDDVICRLFNGIELPKREWDGRNLMLIKEEFVIVTLESRDGGLMFGTAYTEEKKPKTR